LYVRVHGDFIMAFDCHSLLKNKMIVTFLQFFREDIA
jgi:hypothetical protein